MTTLLNTGMRVDEIVRLTWADVTLLPSLDEGVDKAPFWSKCWPT